jgi:hypothetical protein
MSCVATPENTVPWPVSNNEWACHGLRLEHGLEITSFNFTISLNTDTLNKIEWDATQISHDNIHTLALNGKITGVFNLGGTSYHRLHGPMISNKNVNISGGDWDIAKNEGPTNTITYAAAHHKETYDIKNFTPSFFLKYIDSNHFEIVQKNGVNPEWRMDIHDNVKTKINNIKTIDNYLYAFTPL